MNRREGRGAGREGDATPMHPRRRTEDARGVNTARSRAGRARSRSSGANRTDQQLTGLRAVAETAAGCLLRSGTTA